MFKVEPLLEVVRRSVAAAVEVAGSAVVSVAVAALIAGV